MSRWTGLFIAFTMILVLSFGCRSSGPAAIPPDERFGHRFEEPDALDRPVVSLEPPLLDAEYFYYPVFVDSLHIRVAPFDGAYTPGDGAEVEVLVKGVFSNGCLQVHDLEQERFATLIDVTLRMRQPRQALCTAVVRPYRFYFMLEGRYEPGTYTLRLNEEVYPFEVRAPLSDES